VHGPRTTRREVVTMARRRREAGDDEHVGVFVALVRLLWLKLGNVTLIVLALFIFRSGWHLDVTLDGPYATMVVLLLIARFIDGAASADDDERRRGVLEVDRAFASYAAKLLVGSGVLWVAAHGLGGLLE
jgi:hypothetical protein